MDTVCTVTIVATLVCDSLADANQHAERLAELVKGQPGVVEATKEAAMEHQPAS